MTESLLSRAMVPGASQDEARTTIPALAPYLESSDWTVIAVHVIEKAGGAPDTASVEQRERVALDIFDIVTERLLKTAASLERELHYGTDVALRLIDGAL